jgi:hypothetical protein
LSDRRFRVGSKIADEKRSKFGDLMGIVRARLLYEYEYDFGVADSTTFLLESLAERRNVSADMRGR